MKKKNKQATPEQKIVLKILPEEFIVTTSFLAGQFHTTTTTIRWKLPKRIDVFNLNADLEILSDNLQRLAKLYQLEGAQVTTVIPNSLSPMKVVAIPLNLNTSADKKEYAAQQKQAYEFWKEYDEGLVDIKDAQIRSNFLAFNDNDGSSTMLYTACSSKIIMEYASMILGGNLYPIAFIPEDQSIIRIVESRLTRVERERPFCVFYLTKGNSRLIYVNNNVVYIAKVDISDMDEILFDELPEADATSAINSDLAEDDDTDNLFWSEVTNRLSGNLKQAFAFLKDELKATKVETVFFVSDHHKENILFQLFRKNFRLANFRSLNEQFDFIDLAALQNNSANEVIDKKEGMADKVHGSFMLPNLGCYTMQYFSTPAYKNMVIETPLFNLHPKHHFIVRNFKFFNYFKISRKIMSFFLILAVIFFFYTMATDKTKIKAKALQELTSAQSDFANAASVSAAKKAAKMKLIKDIANIDGLIKGKHNEKLFNFINSELPTDLELERVAIRRGSFVLVGNGKSISEVNRFYEKVLSNIDFKDILPLKVFKRADNQLNYFEIKGNVQ